MLPGLLWPRTAIGGEDGREPALDPLSAQCFLPGPDWPIARLTPLLKQPRSLLSRWKPINEQQTAALGVIFTRCRGWADGGVRTSDRQQSWGQEGTDHLCDKRQEPLGAGSRRAKHAGRASAIPFVV